jgi:ferrochelatase
MEAGGERYEYIPCLNAGAQHIDFLASLVDERLAPWLRREDVPGAEVARLAEDMKTLSAA